MHAQQTIEATRLKRSWTTGFTLGPLNLCVNRGETIAVFGKNGAGKSTLFQLLTGAIDREDGELKILGQKMSPDATALRKHVGYLPQESSLPPWTTPEEILTYEARLLNLHEPKQLVEHELKRWDAHSWRHRPLAKSSHGMQRRIGLAVSLIHDPELLILDEPFNALDITNSRTLAVAIHDRASRGKATLVSIHTPLLAAQICPRAILLEGGKLEELSEWTEASLTERADLIERRFFGVTR